MKSAWIAQGLCTPWVARGKYMDGCNPHGIREKYPYKRQITIICIVGEVGVVEA